MYSVVMPHYPTVPVAMDETTVVSSATELDQEIRFDGPAVAELLQTRADTRTDERYDAVVEVEDWATRDKYDIAETHLLLAGEVNDYSEKAVRVQGAFWIDTDTLLDYDYINNVLSELSNEDYDDGTGYLPKTAVKRIVRVEI